MNAPTSVELHGLYAITDTALTPSFAQLADAVEQATLGGARIIQYRDKIDNERRRLEHARTLAVLCHEHGAALIVNDDVELARAVGADGVHLGRDDMSPERARAMLGPRCVIGVSCYNSLSLAHQAVQSGANYVAFGRFFPSKTKPQAVQADPALLREARRTLNVPVAAIGGITPGNAPRLIDAGADMLAVINGVFGQADVRDAARRFAELFE
jgi:thiamine-phosphate pyrophosphorylase